MEKSRINYVLYFATGRTDWNEEHRLQGEVDIPLNETGRQMAYDAAEKYKDDRF